MNRHPAKNTTTCAVLVWLLLLGLSSANAGAIRLSAAASMTDSIRELARVFGKQHPQTTILANFGSSGSLAKQIIQGAPADLYISANQKWMAYLVEKNQIPPTTVRILAHNSLVFIGFQTTKARSLSDLPALKRIALGSPRSVPAGQYAAQAMQKAGVYVEMVQNHQLVMAKDVRQALLYADRGEVDGAFIYQTDAMLIQRAAILFTVNPELHDPIAYPLGLTPSGIANPEARAFYTFLQGKAASRILHKYGFNPTGAVAP